MAAQIHSRPFSIQGCVVGFRYPGEVELQPSGLVSVVSYQLTQMISFAADSFTDLIVHSHVC